MNSDWIPIIAFAIGIFTIGAVVGHQVHYSEETIACEEECQDAVDLHFQDYTCRRNYYDANITNIQKYNISLN